MQMKHRQKKSAFVVKNTSGKIINESDAPIKIHVKVSSRAGRVTPQYSAILAVETKNERMRTVRDYEKQRDALRSAIAR